MEKIFSLGACNHTDHQSSNYPTTLVLVYSGLLPQQFKNGAAWVYLLGNERFPILGLGCHGISRVVSELWRVQYGDGRFSPFAAHGYLFFPQRLVPIRPPVFLPFLCHGHRVHCRQFVQGGNPWALHCRIVGPGVFSATHEDHDTVGLDHYPHLHCHAK